MATKLLLLIPNTSGDVLFLVQGKTTSLKLRTYQHILTILLTDSSLLYRDYGTGLVGLLRGANINSAIILDMANIACITAARSLSPSLRLLVRDVVVTSVDVQGMLCGLSLLVIFKDGLSIVKEFV